MLSDDLNARVVELESRIAFQDDALAALNEVVIEQHQQLNTLTQRLERALLDLDRLRTLLSADPNDEPPPPHY